MGATWAIHNHIAEVLLDWPTTRNALGPDEARELRLCLEACSGNADVRVIILASANSVFSSGGNLRTVLDVVQQDPDNLGTTLYTQFQGLIRAVAGAPVPVISAIDGPAIGLGADLGLAADVTIVGADGWLLQGWMAAGLIPATGGTHLVSRRAGALGLWRFLAGGKVDGPEAERLGLAIAADDALGAARAMAARFAEMKPEALRAMKELVANNERLEATLAMALKHQVKLLTDPDFARRAEILLARRG